MAYKISLIPGDGIGPEVTEAAKVCLKSLGVPIEWEICLAGESALEDRGSLLPEDTLESIKRNKVALKGPITTPVGRGFRSINVELRKKLDLFCCLRPAKDIGVINTVHKNVDIVICRENTEDLYAGVEFDLGDKFIKDIQKAAESSGAKGVIREDTAVSIKAISRFRSERIIRFAFEYALANNRKKVTCVHKANILKYTDGLFLKVFNAVAQDYQGKVDFDDFIIDNLSMQLVLRPERFDVLVLPNLYGDIISDLCAGLVGGLGVAAGANIGENIAVFEPVHGSAPKYAGKNKVNPTATILSAALMLRYLKETEAAEKLEKAVQDVIKEGISVTYDLLPADKRDKAASTMQMAQAIAAKIKNY